MNGVFIVFEGGEATGKTTQLKLLAKELQVRGKRVVYAMEDGSDEDRLAFRALVADRCDVVVTKQPYYKRFRDRVQHEELSPLEQAHIFLHDRKTHIGIWIRPAVTRGKIVLCDRFSPSTFAYQCAGRRLDLIAVMEWDRWVRGATKGEEGIVHDGIWPDRIVLLDGDPRKLHVRLASRGEKLTAFEKLGMDFHERVRTSFLEQARQDPERWRVVNAEQGAENVFADVLAGLESLLSNPETP
ncbi:MAG: thymidylate kinase [Candidatus Niyogibacteria bacterium]|nr:thymidylate kinase [Candidatus Niyogibacteria bacterium]